MRKYMLQSREYPGDTLTPVGALLVLRDRFADVKLLESAEYGTAQNTRSIICFNLLESLSVSKGNLVVQRGKSLETKKIDGPVPDALDHFHQDLCLRMEGKAPAGMPCLVGYFGYDSIQYFETLHLDPTKNDALDLPDLSWGLYEFVLVFDHFYSRITVVQYRHQDSVLSMEEVFGLLQQRAQPAGHFRTVSSERQHDLSAGFLHQVKTVIGHARQGDIFQLVLSRKFSQPFEGDDLQVYRQLRRINPSPYMFYFDYGHFKLFGSSPETHLSIQGKKVKVNPIAGTIRRKGVNDEDQENLQKLVNDPKENAEHDMLIDLARNDLSVYCREVALKKRKEVQQFSHVFHLVSEVEGELKEEVSIFRVMARTFPAGTLSGAPKYRAMQLIDRYEQHQRNYYGGAIGFIDLEGNAALAIMIRTICAQQHTMHYMAGAGITIESKPENELLEIDNKLKALRMAIQQAEISLN